MKPSLVRSVVASCLLATGFLLVSCNNKSATPEATDNSAAPKTREQSVAPNSSEQPAAPKSSDAKTAPGLVIDGERFTTRVVQDPQQGLPVWVFQAPEKWRDNSQVVWNYSYIANPVSASYSVENPANEEAIFGYAAARYFWCTPNYGLVRPGQNDMGQIKAQPVSPAQTLLHFVQQARAGLPKLQIIGFKDLPDLPAALQMPPSQNERGVGIKVTYERDGHPLEEEFYAIFYSVNVPYDGPQGRSWQNNWGLDCLHSFRAPLGSLDRRRPVFAAIAKSFRQNPAWQQRKAAIDAYLNDQFNRQLQAGYDQIAAAGRLSRQISANNDAMIASIDRQLQASRTTSGGTESRSSAEKFDDYIRGVDTVNDPYYGTSQHASTEQYHWTDGYGNYRNSNEASYNPNQNENDGWQLMQPTR